MGRQAGDLFLGSEHTPLGLHDLSFQARQFALQLSLPRLQARQRRFSS